MTLRANAALALLVTSVLGACGAERPAAEGWSVSELPSPAASGSAQAHLALSAAGEPVLSWLEPSGDRRVLKFSTFDGSAWAESQTIASGDDWFVNWADLPSVVPIDAATWIAHWLVLKPEQRYAYDIVYAVSADRGRSWSEPRVLNDDDAIAEHGFVTFFPLNDGIGAVWLDGRRIAALSIEELFASETVVGMSLYFAQIDSDGTVRERSEIDELVCDCCQTDAAVTSAGPIVVYRDRTQEERRDIVVRRSENARFTAPLEVGRDGWIIDGCPVNGPAIDARDDTVAAAWFTAAGDRPRVRFARSRDGGASFAPTVDVASTGAFGQVDVVLLDDGSGIVSWWQRAAEGGMNLVAASVDAADQVGEPRVIAHSPESLPVDVPQMQRAGDTLVFAWSRLDDAAGVYTAMAPVW